jgi:hypothetical protein
MKSSLALLAMGALFASGPHAAIAADPVAHVPDTAEAARAAKLFDRTKQALLVSLHGGANVSDLWMFPTGDPNILFVSYNVATEPAVSAHHLVLIEMRGNRILRLRDFTQPESRVAQTDSTW